MLITQHVDGCCNETKMADNDPNDDDVAELEVGGDQQPEDEEEEEEEEGEELPADISRRDEHGVLYFDGTSTLNLAVMRDELRLRDIGHEAVWSLSTAKPGNGVEQIRDQNIETYWQSDGGHPHLINIQFSKRASVSSVAFFLDFNLDESYTPKQLSIRAGMTHHDLVEVQIVELSSPMGWINVPLTAAPDPLDDAPNEDEDDADEARYGMTASLQRPLRAHFVQIAIMSMHQNGRDTHLRQVMIFGPRRGGGGTNADMLASSTYETKPCFMPEWQTTQVSQYSTIR